MVVESKALLSEKDAPNFIAFLWSLRSVEYTETSLKTWK